MNVTTTLHALQMATVKVLESEQEQMSLEASDVEQTCVRVVAQGWQVRE